MGTRGVYGYRLDGKDKLSYNHFDSYPTGLGVSIAHQVQALLEIPEEELKETVRGLESVWEHEKASPELIEATKGYHDLNVSDQKPTDPYCLFRKAQGDLLATLDIGYYLDANDFIKESLFCEWGYIVNLDEMVLEIWRGFQKEPVPDGRYGTEKDEYDFYPCAMIAEFPLGEVTEDAVKGVEDGS